MKKINFTLCSIALLCMLALGLVQTPVNAEAGGPPPVVVMETTAGRVIVMLTPKETPKTVENFLKYVDAGFYNKTIFHRVIKQEIPKGSKAKDNHNSMNIVQGGGFEYPMTRKRPMFRPIVNEATSMAMPNKKGTIAMARTNDPNSATSQFFFNIEDNPAFNPSGGLRFGSSGGRGNPGYCVFGRVIRGMDVLQSIQDVKTTQMGMHQDVPAKPVYIIKAYRAK